MHYEVQEVNRGHCIYSFHCSFWVGTIQGWQLLVGGIYYIILVPQCTVFLRIDSVVFIYFVVHVAAATIRGHRLLLWQETMTTPRTQHP